MGMTRRFEVLENLRRVFVCGDDVIVNDVEINRVSDTKFLGVIISSNLTWNKHIDVVHSKISKTIGIICKVRHLLPPLGTRSLYLSLVEPYVNYCNIVWAQAYPTVCLDSGFRRTTVE